MFKIMKKYFSSFDEMLKKLNIKLPQVEVKKEPRLVSFKDFNSENDYFEYFRSNIEMLENEQNQYFLFFDNLSTFAFNYEYEIKGNILNDIVYLYNDKLYSIEPLYFISFIESLNKLEYYDNKIWITIESIISKSSIVNAIDMKYYYIILKGFQRFYKISDTTVSPEDVFELIEYHTINKLKAVKQIDLKTKEDLGIINLFTLFGFNLEGSDELYMSMLNKVFRPNQQVLKSIEPEQLKNLYTATKLVAKNVTPNVKPFLSELEKIIKAQKLSTDNNIGNDFLQWAENNKI
jgi:hypothetical protein